MLKMREEEEERIINKQQRSKWFENSMTNDDADGFFLACAL